MSVPPVVSIQQIVPVINEQGRQALANQVSQTAEKCLADQQRKEQKMSALSSESISILPDEVLLHSFSWLQVLDLGKCLSVSRHFNRVVQDSVLWDSLLSRNWGITLKKTSTADSKTVYQNLTLGRCFTKTIELPKQTRCVHPISETELLVGSRDGTISIFNTESGQCLPCITFPSTIEINCLQTHCTKLICGTEDGVIGIFDSVDTKSDKIFRLPVNDNTVNCLHSFGSRFFVGHRDFISVWDIESQVAPCLLQQEHEEGEYDFDIRAIHANSTHIFVGLENGKLEIWDIEKQKCLHRFQAHEGEISCLQVVGSQLISSSGGDCKIKTWDLKTGQCLRTFEESGGGYFQVLGSKIIYDWYNTIKVLDMETGKCMTFSARPHNECDSVRNIQVIGAKIFSITDGHVDIYDFSSKGL